MFVMLNKMSNNNVFIIFLNIFLNKYLLNFCVENVLICDESNIIFVLS